MFWELASFGLKFLSAESQASAQRAIADANYNLDLANQDLNNKLNLAQASKSYNQGLKVANSRLEEITAMNDAIAEANLKNTKAAHYKSGLIQMQIGLARKAQADQRTTLREQAGQALGAVNANAAASGTIGSSVQAASQDVQRKLGEALVKKDEQWDIQAQNFQTQMHDLYAQLENTLKSGYSTQSVQVPEMGIVLERNQVQKALVPDTWDVFVGALGGTIANYATQRCNLGLGSPDYSGNLAGGQSSSTWANDLTSLYRIS